MSDIWPSSAEIKKAIAEHVRADMFTEGYSGLYEGVDNWRSMELPEGDTFEWQADSTYVLKPAFFEGMNRETEALQDIEGARELVKLGITETLDPISSQDDLY